MVFFSVPDQRLCRQGVALTRRNTTGPPCSRGVIIDWRRHDVIRLACPREAACRPAVECYRPRQTTDDDRYQRKLIVCPPPPTHTMQAMGGPVMSVVWLQQASSRTLHYCPSTVMDRFQLLYCLFANTTILTVSRTIWDGSRILRTVKSIKRLLVRQEGRRDHKNLLQLSYQRFSFGKSTEPEVAERTITEKGHQTLQSIAVTALTASRMHCLHAFSRLWYALIDWKCNKVGTISTSSNSYCSSLQVTGPMSVACSYTTISDSQTRPTLKRSNVRLTCIALYYELLISKALRYGRC